MLSKLPRRSIWNVVKTVPHGVRGLSSSRGMFVSGCGRLQSTDAHVTSESHEFKAETRKLLDIVARSLYTDKEVFIRELVSNASDALEKFRFLSSTQQIKNVTDPDLSPSITIEVNERDRTFTIIDTGVGMSRSELIENLGTIARSGSKKFLEDMGGSSDNKIIGQFGVGFYSSFVVADKVKVYSRSGDADKDEDGYVWESDGLGTFTVNKAEGVPRGTKIEIHLKEEAVDFAKYDIVKGAAVKFSSFIDFPLKVRNVGESSIEETEITNQEALWLKTSATEEEHVEFFRFLSGQSYGEPQYSYFFHTDAPMSIKSVFYIPEEAPDRFMSSHTAPKSGVALHSRRVLVTKHADQIVPQWLFWLKGVVDCEDMPLNISRENMQDSALLKKLQTVIVKRFLRFLLDESKRNPEKFDKFYRNYSTFLKAGLLEEVRTNGPHKDQLIKLLRFELVNTEVVKDKKFTNLISLQEYVDIIPDPTKQKSIYYINAPSRKAALASPYMDGLREVPVLLLTDDIDDFVVNSIGPFGEKSFVSIDSGDVQEQRNPKENSGDTMSSDEKDKIIELFKSALSAKQVTDVSFSPNLVSSPAVVTSQLSPHMRKMMKNIMAQSGQPLPSDDQLFASMPVKMELSESDPIIRGLASVDCETTRNLLVTQVYFNAMISAGMVEDARLVLPTINALIRKCLDAAVLRRIENTDE